MKRSTLTGLLVAAALAMGVVGTLNAQNGPQGGKGRGYGGPPASEQERAARQAACLEKNGGVCPNGGPQAGCPGGGYGKQNGAGKGAKRGLRDGTGPRAATGECPLNNGPRAQK